MTAYVSCSVCQTYRIPVSASESSAAAPVCLICQLRQTQQELNHELAATWQALGAQEKPLAAGM